MKTRRDFLRNTTLAGLGMLSLPELAKAVVNEQHSVSAPKITVKKQCRDPFSRRFNHRLRTKSGGRRL